MRENKKREQERTESENKREQEITREKKRKNIKRC